MWLYSMQCHPKRKRSLRNISFGIWILLLITPTSAWRACSELSPALRFPCRCTLDEFGPKVQTVAMDCDNTVFTGGAPLFPKGAPITIYSQRYSGQQTIPVQAFASAWIPVRNLDFSHNLIRRLQDKIFIGIQDTLSVLNLSDNLLGDSLNPIFSTAEFHVLSNLKVLDLSGNQIKGLEEGIFKGCDTLQEIHLNRNNFMNVPTNSLNGPNALKILSLRHNHIETLKQQAFAAQASLERLDLRDNRITTIESGAFDGLNQPKEIYLSGNRLSKMNSDVFQGASSLQKLDLSENFITSFPTIALQSIENLKVLNLSSNMIYHLDSTNFEHLKSLQILDLSRNGIFSVPPSTFRDLNALRYLDLSLNSLRTIEDDAFEGLDSLQTLIIRDNNILLIPGSALGRLPRLSNLYLDYNRVAALSSEILGSIQPEDITHMSLSRNVIRELPAGSFQMFKKLRYLDLSGNSLASVNADTFAGLQTSLNELRISQNKITGLGTTPIVLRGLRILDFSYNDLVDVPRDAFVGMENLQYLNLSYNNHLSPVTVTLFHPLTKLKVLDLSSTGMKTLPIELFANSQDIEVIKIAHNSIQEVSDGSFANLRNISTIDLSYNKIMSIRSSAFINLMSIRKLNLRGNQLSAFKGEFFNTGTGLEEIDVSQNQLSYLFPSSFRIHPRLKRIDASNNKIHFFPSELILSLQFLESVDLSSNSLRTVDELDFARLPRLRRLIMADNELETISEMAFHNSTQLQVIDLSDNKLDRIGERTFEGLIRLEQLNLMGNKLSELPDSIFERNKLQIMENINLSHNKFEIVPFKSLQRQYFFVVSVDLSHNKLKYIPAEDSTMVNIKKLDLSFNPLTKEALDIVLKEPKTVRELNLAGTGLREITALETPFLQTLNLSHNDITDISKNAFQRATLLETLDLSSNLLSDAEALSDIWPMVDKLMFLDLSNNSFESIAQGNLDGLDMLKTLNLVGLRNCSRLEKNAFKNLMNLNELRAFDLPRLGYLDVQGIVELLPALRILDIEIKDSTVGDDDIQASKHPRLRELGLRGQRLLSITPSTFASLKNKNLNIKLCNTSINSLPPTLLFPIPRSSNLDLDITGSEIKVLTPQLLNVFEDRRNSFHLKGLNSNPIHCDCNARALRRWLPGSKMPELKCSSPSYLSGKLLIEVGDDELTCDPKKLTTTEAPKTVSNIVHKSTSRVYLRPSTAEPEIIWSMPPTQPPIKIKTKAPLLKANTLNNDDTLIIGIVGGVVAFIAILIIIICIVRLRMSSTNYHSPPPMAMGMPMGPGSVQLSYKGAPAPAFYTVPSYAQSYSTLPHKNLPSHHQSQQSLNQSRAGYSTMGRGPYLQQTTNGQPFII